MKPAPSGRASNRRTVARNTKSGLYNRAIVTQTGKQQMSKAKMIRHTAKFSDGKEEVRNFKKCLPFCIRSVNTQIRADGSAMVQKLVSFSSVNKAKNLFGKFSGKTVTEIVPVSHSEAE